MASTYNTGSKDLAGVYNAVCELKKNNKDTKVGISVGGWYDSSYFSAGASEEYRLTFAKALARYTDAFGFDVLDLDWEYPTTEHCNEDIPADATPSWASSAPGTNPCKGSAVTYDPNNSDYIVDCFNAANQCQYPLRVYDPVNLVLLMRDCKRELKKLNPDYELTSALRADPDWVFERMPGELISEYLDTFLDMTYDYNAAYN